MSEIFVYMPADVALDERLTKTQLRVLIALYSFRKKNTDTAWPGREALAVRLGDMPLSRISTTTTELVALGWVKKIGNGGRSKSCEYQLTVPDLSNQTVTESVTVPEKETVTKPVTVTKSVTVTDSVTKTVTKPVTKTVTDSVRGIEHANEHANEQVTSFAAQRGKTFLPDDFLPNTANEFEAQKLGVDLNTEVEKFKAHWKGEGAAKADWQAMLKKWLLTAHGYAADRQRDARARQTATNTKDASRAAAATSIFKDEHLGHLTGGRNERAIN